jgi:hypothetical protein
MNITWIVTDKEADYIASCLNTRPHGEVRALLDKLLAQANPPAVPPTTPPTTPPVAQ